MKRARTLVTAVAVAAVLAGAAAALASIRLAPAYHYDFTDCDGGTTNNIPQGAYLVTFKDAVTWMCIGDAGCATGGHFFSPGFGFTLSISSPTGGTTPVSCRSSDLTGDISMTLKVPVVGD